MKYNGGVVLELKGGSANGTGGVGYSDAGEERGVVLVARYCLEARREACRDVS